MDVPYTMWICCSASASSYTSKSSSPTDAIAMSTPSGRQCDLHTVCEASTWCFTFRSPHHRSPTVSLGSAMRLSLLPISTTLGRARPASGCRSVERGRCARRRGEGTIGHRRAAFGRRHLHVLRIFDPQLQTLFRSHDSHMLARDCLMSKNSLMLRQPSLLLVQHCLVIEEFV